MKLSKILVSQPKPTSDKSPYFDIARKYGVEIDFKQFIQVEALSAKEFRAQRINILDYTAIVFTSRHAIDHFFGLCAELRVQIPETMKYFCVSETISLYIQKYVQYRKRKVFFGNGHIQDLDPLFAKHKTEKYFVPASNVHNDDLNLLFDKYGIQHSQAEMYRTVSTEIAPEYIKSFDMLIFFSPHGIDSLKKNVPDYTQGEQLVACFGNVTAEYIKEHGLRLDLEAPSAAATNMPAALDAYLTANNK